MKRTKNNKEKKYVQIAEHYEKCLKKHGDSYLGVDWPRLEEMDIRHRVMLDICRDDSSKKIKILDFGCGLSHFADYIRKQKLSGRIIYSGLDISENFVEFSRKKYPKSNYYCLDIMENANSLPEFDYIIINGVFTQKLGLTFEEMFSFVKKAVTLLFGKARKGIAFNVMSKHVDWENDGLFYLPFDLLADFLKKKISKNYVFRQDYKLYEYTTYIYR